MNRNKFFTLWLCALMFLFPAPIVSAHASLLKSDPPANSAQKIPPTRVQLYFSEAPELGFSAVSVLDRAGVGYDKRDLHLVPGNSSALEISVTDLPPGLYTVAWQVLSAVDGHVTKSSFVFTIGDTPLSDSDPRQIIAAVDAALERGALPPAYEALIRAVNLLLLVALAGSFIFSFLILFPALHIARDNRRVARGWLEYMQEKSAHPRADPALAMWSARWKKFVALAWLGSCVIAVALLGMQALKTSEGLAALPRVLTASRFGSLWLARAALLAALGWILFRRRVDWTSDARQNRALWIALALTALLILNQSLTSHNAAVSDPPYIGLIIDFVHLAGVAIWIGGLFQLLFTFPFFLRALPDDEQARHLRAAIGAFSLVAFVTVGIIIFTGALALIFQVGSVQAYFDTLYGASLFVKFLLIVPLLALGALNLLVNRNAALARVNQFFQNFRFAVALEVICAVGIFLVVGVMTSIAPAIAAYDPASQLVVQTQRVEDLKITLGVSSGLVGANDFDVKVVNANDAAISNALVVRILGTHRDMDMGTQEYVAQNQGNGHYTFRGGVFSMAGTWQLEILVRRAGVEDVRATFTQAAFLQRANASARPLWIENPQALIGLGITLLGFAIGTASALFIAKKKLRLTNLASAIGVALVGMFIVNQVVTSAPPGEIIIIPIAPPIARSLRSPVRQDPATLAAGKQIYQENCATCHGDSGKGDGATAANLNPKPYDLTVHAPLHAEGELFWWVTYGISNTAMIAWESKLNDLQRWQVVQYIRNLALQSAPGAPTPAQFASANNSLEPLAADPFQNIVRHELILGGPDIIFVAIPRSSALSDFDVILQDVIGQPITDAPRVNLIFAMSEMTHGSNYVELTSIGGGHYRARGPWIFMEGKWSVGVIAQLKSGAIYNAVFKFNAPEQSGQILSRAIESSATPHQQVNVSVYPGTLDLKRVAVQEKRAVRVTALLIEPPTENCGGKMILPELNQAAAFSDAGVAELSFIAPRGGELRFKCAKDGLMLVFKNSNDPDD